MKKTSRFWYAYSVTCFVLVIVFFVPVLKAEGEKITAKDDYITCWKQPCVYAPASEWSEKNPNGVAIAVAMGTKSIAIDDFIKEVFVRDFAHFGMTNLKFFFEQNDVPATGVTFHIRGGTEGPYFLAEAKREVSRTAKRAANTNEVFRPD